MTLRRRLENYEENWFKRNQHQKGLKEKSVAGGINTVGSQIISSVLNILATILLARLITPSDFGLVAMVTSFTGFVLLLKDLGLAQAIIQKEKIIQSEINKVFWINTLVSVFLGILIVALGPILQVFYKEPKLQNITFTYALMAIIGGLSVQHAALLTRQMKFGKLAKITIISAIGGQLCGLLLAYLGYGYWAIVSISLVNTTIQTVLLWMNCNWRPHRIKIDFSVRSYLKFGAGVTGFNMINYFSRNLDNILIGKYIGAFQLGLYSKAYQLLMLPINQLRDPLNAVGLPAMSSLRDEQHKYRHYYKEYLFILAFFSIPIVSFLYICANSLILIVLGPNWVASSKIFQLLAITGIIQPIASTRGMVLISTGQSGRYFKWGMWNAVFVIISFFAGLPFGINGIAIAYAIANYLILVPSLYYCFKNTPVQVGDFFYTCLPPFLIAVIAGLLTFFVKEHFDQLVPLTQVLVCLIVYSVSYWGLWMLTPFTRNRLLKISVILKNILNRKSNTELKQKRD